MPPQDPHLLGRVEILRLDLAVAALGEGVDGGLPVEVVPLEDVERQFLVLDVSSAPKVEQGRRKRGGSWKVEGGRKRINWGRGGGEERVAS